MRKWERILFKWTAKYAQCFTRRYYWFLIGIAMTLVTVWSLGGNDIYVSTAITSPSPYKDKTLHIEEDKLPIIIRWNNFKVVMDRNITCNSVKCLMTNNREIRHHRDVLAVLFYGSHFGYGGFPLPRKPGHLWSVMHDESPKNNYGVFCAQGAMNLFNLTATFKRESHYSYPTMWLWDERELTSIEFVVSVRMKNQYRREGLAPIVFVHTDCDVPSDRNHYMRLLQRHIKIDSYGICEHNKEFPAVNLTGMALFGTPDFYRFIAKYKFAFAFENYVCDDYITEKFWRPLRLGVVPVVFGSPKIKEFTPSEHSIIDIRDFRSAKEVAEYIRFLDNNDEEYSKYVEFKQTGITNPKLRLHLDKRNWGIGKMFGERFSGFECFVCEKLHKLKNQMITGQPVEEWQGNYDHYSCPLPKSFDEEGRYIVESRSGTKAEMYAQYYLQSLRYHIEHNMNVNTTVIHKLARELLKKARRKDFRNNMVNRRN